MISYEEKPEKNYIELRVNGRVSNEDFARTLAKLRPRLQNWDHIKIVEVITAFKGMDAKALWKDLKFAAANFGKIRKVDRFALVTDERWIRALTKITSPLLKGEVRTFPTQSLAEARRWAQAS